MNLLGRTAVVVALFLVGGCNRAKFDTPSDGYRSFVTALQRGEVQAAWGALSSPTRAAIEARTKAVVKAANGSVKDDASLPALVTFSSGVKAAQVDDVKVVSESSTEAMLEVTSGGVTSPQRMTKEGDRWLVDLAETFKP